MNSSRNVLEKLEGIVVSYRTGQKTQRPTECIVRFRGITSAKEAARLVGRKVACSVGKQIIKGKIVTLHGKNGFVRARFRRGLSNQTGKRIRITG